MEGAVYRPRETEHLHRPAHAFDDAEGAVQSRRMRALLVSLLLVSVGCGGSIRVVVLDDEGGLLELEGDDDAAHEAAIAHMAQHCGGEDYRVVFDGEATVRVGESDAAPSASESARRMALPSDLPGAVENAGTEPTGGSSLDTDGNLRMASADDGERERSVSFDRRRRLEYECEAEADGEIDEDGDGVIDR